MKTPMQEAIELVKKYDIREIPFKVLLFNLEQLLEKEKEQIIDAFNEGIDEMAFATSGISYYNLTYN
jgi:hypothetical protein